MRSMRNYLIIKNSNTYMLLTLPDFKGYTFKPRQINDSYLNVKEVTIINDYLIDRILTMKFDKSFKRLVSLALRVINDEDADESDTEIVFGEVELVREILLNRYQKFLSYEKEQLLLKKVRLIENELRLKQVAIKQKAMYLENQEEKTIGRSR